MAELTAAVSQTSAALKGRGIKGTLVAHDGRLYWRCTATAADGTRKTRRIKLGLAAQQGQLLEAESRVIALAAAITRDGVLPDPLPWDPAHEPSTGVAIQSQEQTRTTVREWVYELEQQFWQGKVRTSAARLTWQRLETELKRLPPAATMTMDLLVAVASATTPGSRTRLESCKVYKRLGKLAGLDGLERLDAIRTPYEPGERALPTDDGLLELLEQTRSHAQYGWMTAALVVYGCRPSEVFSLQPASDGTARVLT